MVRTKCKTWFAKPVHDVGAVGSVLVSHISETVDGFARAVKAFNGGHDVDYGFCRESRNRGTTDMLDRACQPRSKGPGEQRFLGFKYRRPCRIIGHYVYGRFAGMSHRDAR